MRIFFVIFQKGKSRLDIDRNNVNLESIKHVIIKGGALDKKYNETEYYVQNNAYFQPNDISNRYLTPCIS